MAENEPAIANGELAKPQQNGKSVATENPPKNGSSKSTSEPEAATGDKSPPGKQQEQRKQADTGSSMSHHYRADEALVSPHYFPYTKPSLTPPTFFTPKSGPSVSKSDNIIPQQFPEPAKTVCSDDHNNKSNGAANGVANGSSRQSKEAESPSPPTNDANIAANAEPAPTTEPPKSNDQSPNKETNSSASSLAAKQEIPLHIQCDPTIVTLQFPLNKDLETAANNKVDLVSLRSTSGGKHCSSLVTPFAQLPSSSHELVAHLQVEPLLGSMIPEGVRDAINMELAASPGKPTLEALVEGMDESEHDWKKLATDIKGKVAFFEECMVKQKATRPTSEVVAKITKEVSEKVQSAHHQMAVDQSVSKSSMNKENVAAVVSTPISTKIERVENFFLQEPKQSPTKAVPNTLGSNARKEEVAQTPVKSTTESAAPAATPVTNTTEIAKEVPQPKDADTKTDEEKNGVPKSTENGTDNYNATENVTKTADDATLKPGTKDSKEKPVESTPDTTAASIDEKVEPRPETPAKNKDSKPSEPTGKDAKKTDTEKLKSTASSDAKPTSSEKKDSKDVELPAMTMEAIDDEETTEEFPRLGSGSGLKKDSSGDQFSKSYALVLAEGKKKQQLAAKRSNNEKMRALDVSALKEMDLSTLKAMDISGVQMPAAQSLVNAIVEENKNVYENPQLQEQLTKAITKVPRVTKPHKKDPPPVKKPEKTKEQIAQKAVDEQAVQTEVKQQRQGLTNVTDEKEWDSLTAEKENDGASPVQVEEAKPLKKPKEKKKKPKENAPVKIEPMAAPKKMKARKKKARGQALLDSSETTSTSVEIPVTRHLHLEELPDQPLPAIVAWLHSFNNLLHTKPLSYVCDGIFWFCFLVFGGPIATLGIVLQTTYRLFHYLVAARYRTIVPDKTGKKLAVVVTGCDTGFGRDLAETLIDEGFYVFCGCFQKESLQHFEKMARAIPLKIDVTKDKEVDLARKAVAKWLAEADRTPRCLHALVNNAGIGEMGLVDWLGMAQFQKMMDVNYYGMIRCTKRFLPILKTQAADGIYSDARIVNMVSIAGVVAGTTVGVGYEASKHAADAFSTNLRMELKAFGVNVTAVNPSFHRTPLTHDMESDIRRTWDSLSPEKKAEYGEEYLQNAIKGPVLGSKFINWDAENVVAAMTNSILSKDPPARILIGSDAKYLLIFSRMLPDWFTQYFLNAPRKLPAMMRKG